MAPAIAWRILNIYGQGQNFDTVITPASTYTMPGVHKFSSLPLVSIIQMNNTIFGWIVSRHCQIVRAGW